MQSFRTFSKLSSKIYVVVSSTKLHIPTSFKRKNTSFRQMLKTFSFFLLMISTVSSAIGTNRKLRKNYAYCNVTVLRLSLKHRFGGCDGLSGLGEFNGLDGFDGFSGFGGFSRFDRFSRFSGFGGFVF